MEEKIRGFRSMGKLFEVREFDKIIGNPHYKEDARYRYLEEGKFQELIDFLHEFSDAGTDGLDFMKIEYRRGVGEVVFVRNYVGLLQLKNGFQIQILPKISFCAGEEGEEKTKKIFLHMLSSIKEFSGKEFLAASLNADQMNLYEIFIYLYLQEVKKLVSRGITSGYIEQEENLHYLRGKLLIAKQLSLNLAHRERFYITWEELHQNRPENRIVKATLIHLLGKTKNAKNAGEIKRLLLAFAPVEASRCYEKDFSLVVIDRNTKNYERLMQWSKLFLMNQSFTSFSGSFSSKALLFPMESLYESYVAQQIKKVFGRAGWEISCQDQRYFLFVEPKKFSLRPDLVLTREGRTVVMDTKWKMLRKSRGQNYGINQADMYQMYAYSKKYHTPEVWLLYPVNDEMRGHAPIKFESGDGTCLRLFLVDLARISENMEELRKELE